MHKAMTGTTKPRNTIQHPLVMPAFFQHLGMYTTRNQMVIGKRDPVTITYLACIRPRGGPRWGPARHGRYILCQHWREKLGEVRCVGDQPVNR